MSLMDAEASMDRLYREVIMEHYRSPAHKKRIPDETIAGAGKNPLCGDDVRIALRVEDGVVKDAGFTGEGCALCMASASMLTEMLVGREPDYAMRLIEDFTRFIRGEHDGLDIDALEDLSAFEGVTRFPVRVKCALLPFKALEKALPGST